MRLILEFVACFPSDLASAVHFQLATLFVGIRRSPAFDKRDPSAGVSPLASGDVDSSLLESDIVAKDDPKDWDPIAFGDHYGFTEGRDAWLSDVPGRAPGQIPRPKLIGREGMASPRPSALVTRTPLESM